MHNLFVAGKQTVTLLELNFRRKFWFDRFSNARCNCKEHNREIINKNTYTKSCTYCRRMHPMKFMGKLIFDLCKHSRHVVFEESYIEFSGLHFWTNFLFVFMWFVNRTTKGKLLFTFDARNSTERIAFYVTFFLRLFVIKLT